jgi:glycosyltransferase involved in cell wall biosynthesis
MIESNNALISICIPTYNRATLLKEAIQSCLAQTYRPLQIVIGDDSKNDDSSRLVASIVAPAGVEISYKHNLPRLGQAGNVNDLFERAKGDRLVLLHDDDLLSPNAVSDLAACWNDHPDLTAAFGNQYVIENDGTVRNDQSVSVNRDYHRIEESAGLLPVPSAAGIMRMFPNDAYMVRTADARATAFRSPDLVGDACDFDFGLRLCLRASGVYFLYRYVSSYRLTEVSISKNSHPASWAYALLRDASIPAEAEVFREKALALLAPLAASAFARAGNADAAARVLCSRHYLMRDRMKARFVLHVGLTVMAALRHGIGRNSRAGFRGA